MKIFSRQKSFKFKIVKIRVPKMGNTLQMAGILRSSTFKGRVICLLKSNVYEENSVIVITGASSGIGKELAI